MKDFNWMKVSVFAHGWSELDGTVKKFDQEMKKITPEKAKDPTWYCEVLKKIGSKDSAKRLLEFFRPLPSMPTRIADGEVEVYLGQISFDGRHITIVGGSVDTSNSPCITCPALGQRIGVSNRALVPSNCPIYRNGPKSGT